MDWSFEASEIPKEPGMDDTGRNGDRKQTDGGQEASGDFYRERGGGGAAVPSGRDGGYAALEALWGTAESIGVGPLRESFKPDPPAVRSRRSAHP